MSGQAVDRVGWGDENWDEVETGRNEGFWLVKTGVGRGGVILESGMCSQRGGDRPSITVLYSTRLDHGLNPTLLSAHPVPSSDRVGSGLIRMVSWCFILNWSAHHDPSSMPSNSPDLHSTFNQTYLKSTWWTQTHSNSQQTHLNNLSQTWNVQRW